jgi:hypothetical protein
MNIKEHSGILKFRNLITYVLLVTAVEYLPSIVLRDRCPAFIARMSGAARNRLEATCTKLRLTDVIGFSAYASYACHVTHCDSCRYAAGVYFSAGNSLFTLPYNTLYLIGCFIDAE